MSSYVKCINAFPTGLLFNSPEGPSHELHRFGANRVEHLDFHLDSFTF